MVQVRIIATGKIVSVFVGPTAVWNNDGSWAHSEIVGV